MTLTDLGFHPWFHQSLDAVNTPHLLPARVTRVDRDRCRVRNEHDEVQAEVTGRLLFSTDDGQDLPCVGDWVLVEYHDDGALAIIHDVLPRRTVLRRKAAGRTVDFQMIAANIDVALIMQSCDHNFNLRRMERYIVVARDGGIEPVVLLSKCDAVSAQELDHMIGLIQSAHVDARVVPCSSVLEDGLHAVRALLEHGRTYCLLGSSGVGKTTLLNHLLGREEFETQSVREADGRGRHTTVRRQLSIVDDCGALVIDTPGMRELGMLGMDAGLDESFADILGLSGECRFKDCTHTQEAGCIVLAAVADGTLDEARYQHYLKLKAESDFHQMSHLERRQKDRQFGRMVKSYVKQRKNGKF